MTEGSTAERIADAAMAVIARDGHDALSVRRVAKEVSVTGGTVQHHYPTKLGLTVGALDRCIARQSRRLAAPSRGNSDVDDLIVRLGALLPTDEPRRTEAVVWIAMSAAVSGQTEILARHAEAVVGMRRWLERSIERAQHSGEVPSDVDVAEAAKMIEAGLDGMLLAGISRSFRANVASRGQLAVLVRRILTIDHASATQTRGSKR